MTSVTTNIAARPSLPASIFSRLSAWSDARATRKALGRLSARELEDIGLSRGDIDAVVAGSYR